MRAWPFLLALLLMAGCLDGGAPPQAGTTPTASTPATTPATPTSPLPHDAPPDASLVEANTRFAVALLQELRREEPGKNLVASPFSVSTMLAMLYAGADGTTREAMARTLGFDPSGGPAFHASYRDLLGNVSRPDANRTLEIANSLWLDQAYAVRPAFLATVREMYAGEVGVRDFDDGERVLADVNGWASNKTHGKIPKVLDEVQPDEVLFLLNAVYFKGTWASPFNATCTHEADFVRGDGTRVQVDMMCGARKEAFAYSQGPNGTAVRLPYLGNRASMHLLVPPEDETLDAWLGRLTAEALTAFLDGPRERDVVLQMPKLALKTHLTLNEALQALGMEVAFTDRADLTGIGPNLMVSRVLHDAVLEVDEQGTVAAAVTTGGASVTSLPPPPLELTVDRPYALVLRDDATGSILFVAAVEDPTAG